MIVVGKPRPSTRLAGHDLLDEGAAYVKDGRHSRRARNYGTGGEGRAKCLCGELSPVLPSGTTRKQWHREHKAAIRAQQAGGGR